MATKSKKIGVETPKNFFSDDILATYFFSVDKCPAQIWAKSVTYGSPKWKSYMESPILYFTKYEYITLHILHNFIYIAIGWNMGWKLNTFSTAMQNSWQFFLCNYFARGIRKNSLFFVNFLYFAHFLFVIITEKCKLVRIHYNTK